MTRNALPLIVVLSFPAFAVGGEVAVRPAMAGGESSLGWAGGPHCGLHAAHAALVAAGIPVRFEDLVRPEYARSEEGSTAAELEAAIRDQGGHVRVVEGLTAASLRSARHPMILHVRRPGHNTPFAHWVAFLGCDGGDALILDAPDPIERVPVAELLAHWDGIGLIVSREPVSAVEYSWAGWLESGLLVVVVLGGFVVAKRAVRPAAGGPVRFLFRTAAVLVAAVGAGVVWNAVHDDGLLLNRTAAGHVAVRHFKPHLPEVAADEVAAVVDDLSRVTVIDARFPEAYEAGHLPGAVNLPIAASLARRREVIGQVPRHHKVIVYCQSASCGWADTVASDLAVRGYGDVVVYRGGWSDWVKRGYPWKDR